METLERTYTLDEAAEAIGISRWTLRDWVSRYEVPHRRRGRVKGVYFTQADLEEIIASHARPAAAPAFARSRSKRVAISVAEVPAEFAALRR